MLRLCSAATRRRVYVAGTGASGQRRLEHQHLVTMLLVRKLRPIAVTPTRSSNPPLTVETDKAFAPSHRLFLGLDRADGGTQGRYWNRRSRELLSGRAWCRARSQELACARRRRHCSTPESNVAFEATSLKRRGKAPSAVTRRQLGKLYPSTTTKQTACCQQALLVVVVASHKRAAAVCHAAPVLGTAYSARVVRLALKVGLCQLVLMMTPTTSKSRLERGKVGKRIR